MRRAVQGLIAVGIAACACMAVLAAPALAPRTAKAVPVKKPQRIMSMDMCDDLLLLMLVPKERIASITYLAHDAASQLMPGRDAGVAINHGTSEEILRQQPDLILSSPWSTPAARRLAKRVGATLIEVDSANDFDGIRQTVRQVGAAVGEPARAEMLIRRMDAELKGLKARRARNPLRVVVWTGDGSVPGEGTLTNAIITAAGGDNIAAKRSDNGFSSFGIEELLVARPDAIMQGVGSYDQPSLHETIARHPLIDRLFAGRQIDYPDAGYTCGLPQAATAARELADAFAKIPRGGARW